MHLQNHQLIWPQKCIQILTICLYAVQSFFNHESPRRSDEYVTKKIIKGVCDIYFGKQKFFIFRRY